MMDDATLEIFKDSILCNPNFDAVIGLDKRSMIEPLSTFEILQKIEAPLVLFKVSNNA